MEKLPWIVLILIGLYFCYSLWKAGRYREPDKEIYDKELRKRKSFDGIADYLDTGYNPSTQCQDCNRFDKLTKKALDEIELRDKLKKIVK